MRLRPPLALSALAVALAAVAGGCPGPAEPTGPPVFSRTTAPVREGDLCSCLALPGELTPAEALARIPAANAAPAAPPQSATRERALAFLRARRSDVAGPLSAMDRALDAARQSRDIVALNTLNDKRIQIAAMLQTLDDRISSVRSDPSANPQVFAYQMQVGASVVQRTRQLVDEARSSVSSDCWCFHWSPRGNTVRFASILIVHRPRRRDLHSVTYVLDGREVLYAERSPASRQGTVTPGAHRLEAITTLQSGRKITTRGTFNVGPPWALAIEHRLDGSGSRFSRQRLRDPLAVRPPGVP